MKKFPNAFVIVLFVILFSWIITFLIPQGAYDRLIDPISQRTTVVPDSYTTVDAPTLSAFDALMAIPKGIAGRAELITLILLLGGCFYVIEKTGALHQGLNKLISVLSGNELIALILITWIFLAAGFTIAMQEEIIAMTPILLLFGRSLGYNTLTILGATYGSSVVGSAFSPFNPFGVLIAQKEAEIELLSGLPFRLVVLAIACVLWTLYIARYAQRHRVEKEELVLKTRALSLANKLIIGLLAFTFIIVTYGLISWGWAFNEMSACFFLLALSCGLIAKFGLNKTTELYVDGFKDMVFACIIIGLANSISIILSEGQVIDTVVYGLFSPLEGLPPALSALLMMGSQCLLHFPIPSYSGQAILTMPILTPLSDLIGLSRQVSVLAYQYGAIMMDVIVPTNGALMAVIALGEVKYNQWIKFILKPTFMILGVAVIAILTAVYVNY
ncbi:YfcC family protein [Croceiramulus getboli]|nr:Na+/H+ antiporter NhaC family protein [Flavobacteriaceae bacterium YJPT1-3]